MKFFAITCKRGHNGQGHACEITFAIKAKTCMDAVNTARNMPGVQHSQLPTNTREIDEAEYNQLRSLSAYERAGNAGIQRKQRRLARGHRH